MNAIQIDIHISLFLIDLSNKIVVNFSVCVYVDCVHIMHIVFINFLDTA